MRARLKAERPRQILEAAFDTFVAKGYAATRLEDVAAQIGVTKGTIYVYFGSKEKVFGEAIQTVGAEPMMAFADAMGPWSDDIAADLKGFLERLYRFISEHPRSGEALRLVLAEGSRFPALVEAYFDRVMDPVFDRFQARLIAAQSRGEIDPGLNDLAELILSTPFAQVCLQLLFTDKRVLSGERIAKSHLDMVLRGVLVARPGSASAGAPNSGDLPWSEWRRFPDPRRGECLVAPFGAGLFELRLADGERLMPGIARSVASRLSTLVPAEIADAQRASSSRRRFFVRHLAELEYRTKSCLTYGEAQARAGEFTQHRYRFSR